MLCSACHSIRLSNSHEQGFGWQCVCGEINCADYLRCPHCQQNRYEAEKKGWIDNGHLTALGNMVGRQDLT